MVEKNGLCPSCRKDKSVFEDTNLSWHEIRGLSWLFCEDCVNPVNEKGLKTLITCA